tara:strand:- start:175 stop:711 length:537 start_codon:yes stop_codon:yes gene_type:complete
MFKPQSTTNMPKRKRKNTECSICMGKAETPAKLSGCSHIFCKECILEWAKQENSCPNCRATFKHIKCGRKKTKVKDAKQRPDEPETAVEHVDFLYFTSEFLTNERFRFYLRRDVSYGLAAASIIMDRVRRDLVRLDRQTPTGIFEVMQHRIPIRARLDEALEIWNSRPGGAENAITVS